MHNVFIVARRPVVTGHWSAHTVTVGQPKQCTRGFCWPTWTLLIVCYALNIFSTSWLYIYLLGHAHSARYHGVR